MDQLEVMPVSSKVVCLNAPHLKSLCVFEALSRTLGCYYNHHRPQIVSCVGKVRLPVPRVTRIRGHTTHTHTPGDTPTLHTLLQMGTYLVFHLSDWTQVQQCQLLLNGIEKVPRTDVPPRVILERVNSTTVTSRLQSLEGEEKTNDNASASPPPPPPPPAPNANNSVNKLHTKNNTLASVSGRVSCAIRSLGFEQKPSNKTSKNTKGRPDNSDTGQRDSACGVKGQHEASRTFLTLSMEETEEVTTLLDDEEDEYTSDTSDDLHKVVRKRLLVDITSLLEPLPPDKVLILLLRPAEETQAWQFLSSCIKVTQFSSKGMAVNGSGTMKKALTRTKPLYFSRNGNAHRI